MKRKELDNVSLFYKNYHKNTLQKNSKWVLRLVRLYPYNPLVYHACFFILYKAKKWGRLYRLLKEGTLFLPRFTPLKEWLLFLLSFHSSSPRLISDYLLVEIIPLFKKKKDCAFLLYCCSHYFLRSFNLKQAYFYSSSLLKYYNNLPLYMFWQHFFILEKFKNHKIMRDFFAQYPLLFTCSPHKIQTLIKMEYFRAILFKDSHSLKEDIFVLERFLLGSSSFLPLKKKTKLAQWIFLSFCVILILVFFLFIVL